MVSQYNEFVREYAKKCRKQGKKFELADAAKAWRGIRGGDWRSFLGLKRKSPTFYTSLSGPSKPISAKQWEIYRRKKEQERRAAHAMHAANALRRL